MKKIVKRGLSTLALLLIMVTGFSQVRFTDVQKSVYPKEELVKMFGDFTPMGLEMTLAFKKTDKGKFFIFNFYTPGASGNNYKMRIVASFKKKTSFDYSYVARVFYSNKKDAKPKIGELTASYPMKDLFTKQCDPFSVIFSTPNDCFAIKLNKEVQGNPNF